MAVWFTRMRPTRYSDHGYVFEAPGLSMFRRGVRVYLVGNRDDLWMLNQHIDALGEFVNRGELTLEMLLRKLARIQRTTANLQMTHTTTKTLVPFRTTHRVEVSFLGL